MRLVKPEHTILYPQNKAELDRELRLIETAGRTAYKSEEKITETSALPFITGIVKRGHFAVIEFGNMIVKFITDRGITHEIVRHRLCSFIQESTRYCNYSTGKFEGSVAFIKPSSLSMSGGWADIEWGVACGTAERTYFMLLKEGQSPQVARSVLPNSTKAEIIVKANFRERRHIFKLRAVSKAAHPDMRVLMIPLYLDCRALCPEIFDLGDPE
jgi:thymidylate synthase (FAD)